MQICITLNISDKLKKIIDDIRYHYDRKLIKENYQYIHVIPPVETFINLKVLEKKLQSLLKSYKRVKIITDVVSYTYLVGNESVIFLNIENCEKIKDMYEDIKSDFFDLRGADFFPHIVISKNHSIDETELIYEELKQFNINEDFFSSTVSVYIKDKIWYKTLVFEL